MQAIVHKTQAGNIGCSTAIAAEHQVTFDGIQLHQQLQTPNQSAAMLQQSHIGGSDVKILQIEDK